MFVKITGSRVSNGSPIWRDIYINRAQVASVVVPPGQIGGDRVAEVYTSDGVKTVMFLAKTNPGADDLAHLSTAAQTELDRLVA